MRDGTQYAYRILRKGETPWMLRVPGDCSGLDFLEKRALLVTAVATGNNPQKPSPFLHATRNLRKALLIHSERRHLYSNFLVRWPRKLPNVEMVDFQEKGQPQRWLFERDEDSALVAEAVFTTRAYTEKDSEIVYFGQPPSELVEWWDEEHLTWRGCLDGSAQSQYWVEASENRAASGGAASSSTIGPDGLKVAPKW